MDRIMKSIFDETKMKQKGAMKMAEGITADTPDITTPGPVGNPGSNLNDFAGHAVDGVTGGMKGIMGLASMNFDTSAEGSGPGQGSAAALSGAVHGAQAGQAIGEIFGPAGKIIGGVAGGIGGTAIGLLGHGSAKKEYAENRRLDNMEESAEEKMKRQKQYFMDKGLADIQAAKDLTQKSLGII